jgi:hypothetical protein
VGRGVGRGAGNGQPPESCSPGSMHSCLPLPCAQLTAVGAAAPAQHLSETSDGAGEDSARLHRSKELFCVGGDNPPRPLHLSARLARAALPLGVAAPALDLALHGDAALVVGTHRHLRKAVAAYDRRRHGRPGGQREAKGCGAEGQEGRSG